MYNIFKKLSTDELIEKLKTELLFAQKTRQNVEEFEEKIKSGDIEIYTVGKVGVGNLPTLKDYDREFRSWGFPVYQQSPFVSAESIYHLSKEIASRIISEKSIPPNSLRKFEMAYKMVNRSNKISSQVKWIANASEILPVLLESSSWPDAQESTFEINNITVVNQTKHDVSNMENLILKASELILNSRVKNVAQVVDSSTVWILSDVNRNKRVKADYVLSKDLIRLYYVNRFTGDELNSLVHEWGHRLWNKFLGRPEKELWVKHHYEVSRRTGNPEMPKVGDKLDYVKGKPVVAKIDNDLIWFTNMKTVKRSLVFDFLSKHAAFPTDYSAKNHEEHFCEAFALYCEGKLNEPHKSSFENIFVVPLNENKFKTRKLVKIIWG
jgi:hypothetical protein